MPPTHRRFNPVLSGFPSCDPARTRRDLLRKSVERLFLPFIAQPKSSPLLSSYRFRENLETLLEPSIVESDRAQFNVGADGLPSRSPRAARNSFLATAQLNGEVGTSKMFEDLFAVMLSGFDFVHVTVENKDGSSIASPPHDPCHFRGSLILAHTRPFLGWLPSHVESPRSCFPLTAGPTRGVISTTSSRIRLSAGALLPFSTVTENVVRVPMTLSVPFSAHVEGSYGTLAEKNFVLSQVNLRVPFARALAQSERESFGLPGNQLPVPPADVLAVVNSKEAMKLTAVLLHSGVKPQAITAQALLSSIARKQSWAEARATY